MVRKLREARSYNQFINWTNRCRIKYQFSFLFCYILQLTTYTPNTVFIFYSMSTIKFDVDLWNFTIVEFPKFFLIYLLLSDVRKSWYIEKEVDIRIFCIYVFASCYSNDLLCSCYVLWVSQRTFAYWSQWANSVQVNALTSINKPSHQLF